jgi:hypothetical protein
MFPSFSKGVSRGYMWVRFRGSQPRNCALADTVAARQFCEGSTLRPSPSGFGLLRLGQFRFAAHALPALRCPAAALGGAGADNSTG